MTTFFRLFEASVDDKAVELLKGVAAVRVSSATDQAIQRAVFERASASFADVPGTPLAYWVSDQMLNMFKIHSNMTNLGGGTKCGLGTLDDFRFLRLWWEGSAGKWVPFPKGGVFSLWYSSIPLVLNWFVHSADGKELKTFVEARVGSASRKIQAQDFYFRPGLTWPRRTQSGLNMRVMPGGCVFADKGPAAFIEGDDPHDLLALLAITTSSVFRYLVDLQMTFGSYEVGVIQRTPVPEMANDDRQRLAGLARRAWSLKRQLDTVNETSHAFVLPPGLNERATGLDRPDAKDQIQRIQHEIDDVAFDLYGIGGEDRAEIEAADERGVSRNPVETVDADDEAQSDREEDDAPVGDPVAPMLSWLVGVAFGRFDPRLVTGERPAPPEPEPFDPLPARSPGMWPAEEEHPVPPPDILVDDAGHARDVCARVSSVAATVGLAEPEDVRRWLAREFFPLHIKMYSKSRRRAPIYWQLATPSASYSVWLYLHAFTPDTMFRVQQDFVEPKLAQEERRLETVRREPGSQASAAERKALAAQEDLVEELRRFLEEVRRVVPLWDPDLDDGVIINFAPLWRLVPHHRPWQKELKSTWDALCAGRYDWAHLAMRLWPERVVPKCASDRSLAIAHGVEDVFWVEGSNGKWGTRKSPTRPVDDLVQERTSPAVKTALRSLLDAPASNGGRGRRRAARTAPYGGAR